MQSLDSHFQNKMPFTRRENDAQIKACNKIYKYKPLIGAKNDDFEFWKYSFHTSSQENWDVVCYLSKHVTCLPHSHSSHTFKHGQGESDGPDGSVAGTLQVLFIDMHYWLIWSLN